MSQLSARSAWMVLLLGLAIVPASHAITRDAPMLAAETAQPLPALTHTRAEDWLNSRPLSTEALRGKVVLVEFWTFACWNCYRSIPWLNTLDRKFAKDFVTLGVHTPELPQEYELARVKAKLAELSVSSPVMIDNDYSFWKAMGNRYWPAFYLVDRQGRVRAHYAGETHAGDRNARRMEADIEALLKEPPPS